MKNGGLFGVTSIGCCDSFRLCTAEFLMRPRLVDATDILDMTLLWW